jgi:hypothetical protein
LVGDQSARRANEKCFLEPCGVVERRNCNVNGEHARVPVIIPADTAIRVRTVDPIDANSAQPSAGFRGSSVDPLKSSSGAVVIPRGASVQLIVANVKKVEPDQWT